MWGCDSERQGKAGSSNDNYRTAGDELRPQSAALLDAMSPFTAVPSVYHLYKILDLMNIRARLGEYILLTHNTIF